MSKREEFLREVNNLIDVLVVHKGRTGFGVDCAGLIIVAARRCGLDLVDDMRYGLIPEESMLYAAMLRNAYEIPAALRRPGDIVQLRVGRQSRHLAVIIDTEENIVHASPKFGVVRVSVLSPRLIGFIWRLKEFRDG